MESIVESKGVVFSYDGKMVHRKYVWGRTDIGYCVRSFIWNKVKYAILEKGSYIEKWSDLNEQSRDM